MTAWSSEPRLLTWLRVHCICDYLAKDNNIQGSYEKSSIKFNDFSMTFPPHILALPECRRDLKTLFTTFLSRCVWTLYNNTPNSRTTWVDVGPIATQRSRQLDIGPTSTRVILVSGMMKTIESYARRVCTLITPWLLSNDKTMLLYITIY